MRLSRITTAVVLSSALLAAAVLAEDTLILKSGEQYQCTIESSTEGELLCRTAGEARTFPIERLQRIDFQRQRLFDDIETADALAEADPLFAEVLGVDTAELKSTYPEAGYVVLKDETNVTIRGSRYAVERTRAWRIIEQRGADSASRAIYYFPGINEPQVVFGITVGPSGEVVHLSDVAVKDEAVYPGQPEYNYLHRLRFSLKNAVPGSTLFVKTRLLGTATVRLPMVVDRTFWGEEPALARTVSWDADEATRRRMSVETSGGLQISGIDSVTLSAPQVFWESLMPPTSGFAPRIVIAYPAAGWPDVAGAFTSTIADGGRVDTGVTRAEALYDLVRNTVRTIGVPLDALPAPPRAPAEVFDERYGTVVEKALLLERLLHERGYKASTVLVRGRDSGPLLEGAPRLKGFDSAVVRLVTAEGDTVWLQCDSTKRAFAELSGDVQGASGLDLSTGEVVLVPPRAPAMEGQARSTEVTLEEDGSALVTDRYELTGNHASGMRFIADMSADEAHKWAASAVGSVLPGVELVEFEHSMFEPLDEVETLSFTYRVPALAQKAGGFLILRLPNARFSPVEVGRSERRYGLFWLGAEEERSSFRIIPPEGYEPYALPEGATFEEDGWLLEASFDTAQDETGDDVFYGELWQRTALDAPREAYDSYRRALITRGLLRNEIIVFVKKAD